MSFANRVVLITGAGSGLGRQLARTLAADGAAIAAIDLHPEPLSTLAGELSGKRVAWAVGDVTSRDSLRAAVAQVRERLGPIDVLIANAGIGRETSALRFRAEDVEAQIQVNLTGVANSIEMVLPAMIERRSGHLVAISSLASYRGLSKMAGYCASKSGVNGLMEALRLELRPYHIDVTIICPGWVRTPLTENIDVPKPFMMDVAYAARQIADAIRARRKFFAFPRPGVWRLRLLRWLPAGLSDWMAERALRRLTKTV
jgi:NAD(P)-dependent dehydrogenase (short-subunit alcohol dehydrogenase family)